MMVAAARQETTDSFLGLNALRRAPAAALRSHHGAALRGAVGQLRRGCQRCRAALPGTAAERCAITMLLFFIFQLFDLIKRD